MIEHELVREAMKKTGIEIGTMADVPSEGSGLGSSSAVTVGLLHTLYDYQGELVTPERLAREACEIDVLQAKRASMDALRAQTDKVKTTSDIAISARSA